MEFDKKRFKQMFPHLADEMHNGESQVSISSVRTDANVGERMATSTKRFDNYMPDVIDFLRRCDNEKQAEEIIEYMYNRKEITADHAQRLKNQLKAKGVRSFGPKKQDDYYSRESTM
jgi:hypothetical protein